MTILATLTNFAFFLAQATAPAAAPDAAPGGGQAQPPSFFNPQTLLLMVLLFGGMYFLMIAPQRKKQKEMQKMLAELDTGAEVMTTSGIFGTIANKRDDRFVLRIADGVKIEIAKSAVQTVIKKSGQDAKA